MAPEQARGEKDVDGRADLYGVGAILYRMVTGQRPYTAPNFNALLFAIAQGQLERPRKLEPARVAAPRGGHPARHGLDPRARFQTAARVRRGARRGRPHARALGGRRDAGGLGGAPPSAGAEDAPETASGGWQSRTLMGETPRPARMARAISTTTTVAVAIDPGAHRRRHRRA